MYWTGKTQSKSAWRSQFVAIAAVLLSSAALFMPQPAHAQRQSSAAPVIVDTDAGADDLMAIAFLLSRPDVHIEAITIANGVAHVPAGARNVLRLLALAHRVDIPVYLGRETPLAGNSEFPAEWRKEADELPGVALPQPARKPQPEFAAIFLARRLSDRTHPVRILALGPLTNLAQVLGNVPPSARTRVEIVITGGAFRVRGNLGDGGAFHTDNITAEWNFFVDPAAANQVLGAGARSAAKTRPKIRLVPLDATNQVPIDSAFLKRLSEGARTDLAKSVAQILGANRELIDEGVYSAWDPLAAVALVSPAAVRMRCVAIEVRQSGSEAGRTVEIPKQPPNACVAFGAVRKRFYQTFLAALEPDPKQAPR